ncbi:YcaO-like family protein [Lysobacter sp. cf310]|uniref:YcaO-like family protein n=1 Tax=Lysobacter sp. cf310 TaxID=1761790 RepID=UPI0008EA7EC0|nr:YcaO-like family protein [Lysobacter sp. cf310]SFK94945.1 ribosomal protein S12 methylthiotransferase accessory factor [Lysobacter sp. cf310]
MDQTALPATATDPEARGAGESAVAPIRVFGEELRLMKSFWDGTQRACDPEDTVRRLQALAPRIGLTRLANVTGLDVIGVPVWVAIRPNSRGLATAQGKGLTHAAAKASALMESVECWHAETIERPVYVDSPWSLRRRAPIVQYERLSHYEDSAPRADQPIAWVEGYDLLQDGPVWVPLESVSTNYVGSGRRGSATTFMQSSNGLAGGNEVLEAITHALKELIERDAIHHAGDAMRSFDSARRVSIETIDAPDCRAVLDKLDAAGVSVAAFDLSSDLDIPVYGCSIVDADDALRWRTLPHFNGYGCHLNPGIALLRALTEAVQSRLTYISGSRDDIAPGQYRSGGNPNALKSFREAWARSPASLDFRERKNLATTSFNGDIRYLLDRLRAAGIENAVAVDLRKPDIGVSVVRMVVPGLAGALSHGRAIRVPERDRLARPAGAPR